MNRRDSLEQLRRILLLAIDLPARPGVPPQLDLFFSAEEAASPSPSTSTELNDVSDLVHALVLELLLLIRMEQAGLVETPLRKQPRRRLGLGSTPSLRLLEEWEGVAPEPLEPWQMANPWPGREEAFRAGIAHARALAQAAGMAGPRIQEIARRLYLAANRSAREDDLAGMLYAHGGRHTLRMGPTGRPVFRRDRERMRGNGLVFTPEHLARELTATLLRESETDNGALFLDPACGSGPFLLAAAVLLAGRPRVSDHSPTQGTASAFDEPPPASGSGALSEGPEHPGAAGSSERREQLDRRLQRLRNLHGVDLDPQASRLAAWNLSLWAAQERGEADAGHLDTLFGKSFPYFLGTNIQTGNSLLREPSSFSPGFLWERRFPHAFERERPGFDVVLGNPPWISFGLRDRVAASGEERAYYERLYPAGTQYKLTLYPLFMELALGLCRPGGTHGFLVPDSVLSGHHFSRIRKLLLTQADPIEFSLVQAGTWSEVSAGHTLLYAVRRKGGSRSAPKSVRNRMLGPVNGEPEPPVWVPAASYSSAGSAPLRIFRDDGEMAFLSRIQETPFRFRDVAWTYSGLIGRYGQKTVQSSRPVREYRLRDRRGATILEDGDAIDRWRPALLSGGEVTAFSIRWRGGHLYLPEDRAGLVKTYKSGFDLQRYGRPKIFLRQTGDCLIAARDMRGLFCLNNLHLVGPLDWAGIDPLILTGILTSEPVQRAYRIYSLERSRPLAQVDLKIVEDLPYPSDSGGVPVGAGRAPRRSLAQARRVMRAVDRAVRQGESSPVIELTAGAWRAGADPFGDGSMAGREVLTILLLRLLEHIETVSGSGNPRQTRPRRKGPEEQPWPGLLLDEDEGGSEGESEAESASGRRDIPGTAVSVRRRGKPFMSLERLQGLLNQMVSTLFQLPGSPTV